MTDPLDGPVVGQVTGLIERALGVLGPTSDDVAVALRGYAAVVQVAGEVDPVCRYLQLVIDPGGREVQVLECGLEAVEFAVINPDAETWTRGVAVLPAAVRVFCCRLDAGDFPDLGPRR